MEKKLIYFNESTFKSELSSMEDIRERCQAIIDKFISLEIGEFTNSDFNNLLFDTENFLFIKTMQGKDTEFLGMKLNKMEAYRIVEKPAGYAELTSMAKELKKLMEFRIKNRDLKIEPKSYLKMLEFSASGELKVQDSVIEDLRAKNEVYAINERAQLVHDFATKFAELINESELFIKVRAGSGMESFGKFLHDIIDIDNVSRKAEIKLNGIKHFDYVN